MKLIVGLGNPGKLYQESRHNIGFLVINSLAQDYKVALKRDQNTFSLSSKVKIGQYNVILAKPLTFMNLSGAAVKALLKKHKVALKDLLVICDDLDLGFARIKLRPRGSAGGHNGLESIIGSVGSMDFARMRLGIGRPKNYIDPAEYVLSSFSKKEKEEVAELLEKAASACELWAREGIEKTMNIFNQIKPKLTKRSERKFDG